MKIELQTILSSLQAGDKWLLELINKEGANSFFDWLLPYWRTPTFWAPAYLLLLLIVVYRFKKKALWWVLFFIATVSLVDFTGNQLIKQTIQRVRPCNDPTLLGEIILRMSLS